MSKALRFGNLALSVTAPRLAEICASFGTVSGAKISESPFSGKSRGFGFIEMSSETEAAACLAGLNEKDCDGQKLAVTVAPADSFKKTRKKKV